MIACSSLLPVILANEEQIEELRQMKEKEKKII